MTKGQVETYEYCKNHLSHIRNCEKDIKFGVQKYGCGGGTPNIERTLEKLHNKMFDEIMMVFENAKTKTQEIIDNI